MGHELLPLYPALPFRLCVAGDGPEPRGPDEPRGALNWHSRYRPTSAVQPVSLCEHLHQCRGWTNQCGREWRPRPQGRHGRSVHLGHDTGPRFRPGRSGQPCAQPQSLRGPFQREPAVLYRRNRAVQQDVQLLQPQGGSWRTAAERLEGDGANINRHGLGAPQCPVPRWKR